MSDWIKGILGTIGILLLGAIYCAFIFLTTFREYNGTWYNCIHATTANAKTACGVKEDND